MNAILSSLPGWLDSARQKYHLPSISAAVTLGAQVIWKDACGCARLENGQPAAPDHVYPIGSVTKVFITTALMQMTEMGILGLLFLARKCCSGRDFAARVSAALPLKWGCVCGDGSGSSRSSSIRASGRRRPDDNLWLRAFW